LSGQGQSAEMNFLFFTENRLRVSLHRLGHLAKCRRAPRVFTGADGVIVIPPDYHCRALSNELDHFRWARAIVYEVPQHPKFVPRVRHRSEGLQVRMDIGQH
jgi:hypothetical protein